VSRYVCGGMLVTRKVASGPVISKSSTPVTGWDKATDAPTSPPPCESVTRPVRVAVVWAEAGATPRPASTTAIAAHRRQAPIRASPLIMIMSVF
jgi:hypothetical protein